MKLSYPTMEEQCLAAFKGGEKAFNVKMFSDEKNKIMHGRLVPGASIGYHVHQGNCEIIYILSGSGKALFDQKTTESLNPGDCLYCPEGHGHDLVNDGTEDLVFFAVVPVQ